MTYYQICWYFLIYSFGGWALEVVYHAVACGKVINRGFLNGPVCPVYGFGVLSVFAMMNTFQGSGYQLNDGMIFLFGVILATAVELIAGWLLDVCFHARWWDYSNKPLNFHGYICLEFLQNDLVIVNPLKIKRWIIDELEASMVLYFTGASRSSAAIIDEQKKNTSQGNSDAIEAMHKIKQSARDMKLALLKGDIDSFADILREGWENKKKMASHITNPVIQEAMDVVLRLVVEAFVLAADPFGLAA